MYRFCHCYQSKKEYALSTIYFQLCIKVFIIARDAFLRFKRSVTRELLSVIIRHCHHNNMLMDFILKLKLPIF